MTSLTGVRGLAACWVMAGHYVGGLALPATMTTIAFHSYVAVDLFMILSGFVLAMTYESLFFEGGKGRFQRYVLHRLARIYPLFVITTFVCWLLAAVGVHVWGDPSSSAGTLAANLMLVHTWGWPADALNAAGWSISTEWAANLLFPLFVVMLLGWSMRRGAVVAGVALLCLVMVALLYGQERGPRTGAINFYDFPLGLVRCVTEFMLGVFCWRLRARTNWVAKLGGTRAQLAILAAIVPLTLFPSLDLVLVLLACLLVVGLSFERSVVSRGLGSPVPRWLGAISFSIYLWQMPLMPLRPWLAGLLTRAHIAHPETLATVVVMGVVIAVSALSFPLIERPAQRWIKGNGAAYVSAVIAAPIALGAWVLDMPKRLALVLERAFSSSAATPPASPER